MAQQEAVPEIGRRGDAAFNAAAPARQFFQEYRAAFLDLRRELARQTRDPRGAHDAALEMLSDLLVSRFLEQRRALTPAPSPGTGEGRSLHERLSRQAGEGRFLDEHLSHAAALLDRYNFTPVEKGPLDDSPAIDPAMLGTLCENLAAGGDGVDRRAESGVFYTPRAEIDLMCRLALVDYLANHLGARRKSLLDRLVFSLEPQEKTAADAALARAKLWPTVRKLLGRVAVLDPACGAGSFLVGMLHALDDLLERADRQLGIHPHARRRRERIAQRSLYGVDVMPWACRAARIRVALAVIAGARGQGGRESFFMSAGRSSDVPEPLSPTWKTTPDPFGDSIRQGDFLLSAEALFPERRSGRNRGFDIVLGNPPYVRKENIADPSAGARPASAADKRAYKQKLAERVYSLYPQFFGPADPARPQRRLNAQSDLYVYFYYVALSLLAPRGTLCFLTSSSWLDAGYGADLRQFLLAHSRLRLVLDNQAARSFARADVNTVITLASAPGPAQAAQVDNAVRFVTLRVPFTAAIRPGFFPAIETARTRTATPSYRVHPVSRRKNNHRLQGRMDLQVRPREAVRGDAPADPCRMDLQVRPREPAHEDGPADPCRMDLQVRPREAAHEDGPADPCRMDLQVRPREAVRGDGPGGPSYGPFYGPSYGPSYGSDLAAASKWGGPYLRAPDIYWTILEKAGALLVPLSELAAVEGYIHDNNTGPRFPNVPFLKSVKDADRIGLMRRSAGVVRYGVKPEGNSRTVAPILFPRTFGTRHLVLWNREGVYGKEFYKVLPRDPEQVVPLAAQLNGTLAVLQRELVGLANLGDGALKFSAADVGQFLVVPDLPPEPLSRAFRRMAARPALDLAEELRQHDRHRMDAAIFDALGLSAAEREAIYEAVLRLVENRLRKARSVKEREM